MRYCKTARAFIGSINNYSRTIITILTIQIETSAIFVDLTRYSTGVPMLSETYIRVNRYHVSYTKSARRIPACSRSTGVQQAAVTAFRYHTITTRHCRGPERITTSKLVLCAVEFNEPVVGNMWEG